MEASAAYCVAAGRRTGSLALIVLLLWLVPPGARPAGAQFVVSEHETVITLPVGTSAILVQPIDVTRFSVTNPAIADAVPMTPQELLVNGLSLGTTTLAVWDSAGSRRLYSVEVTPDVASLQRFVDQLFPDENLVIQAQGNTLLLNGRASAAHVANRVLELAEATGAQVIDNLQTPAPTQILLQVRFAEVNRTALEQLGPQVINTVNPHKLDSDGRWSGSTDSEGILTLSLIESDANLNVIIRALQTEGEFRSLAEPALMTIDGTEASFLAGGEFPFPAVQGGGASNAVTVEWREFGVRLNFTPYVTNIGNIRMQIAPEVSVLDFASGLTISGFQIPSILARRAQAEVELREGQHLAIAGLLDNTIQENIDKLPFLGDIPILGALFRSKDLREEQSELLVIVSPSIVQPSGDAPEVPTGEPDTWDWQRLRAPADTTQVEDGGGQAERR